MRHEAFEEFVRDPKMLTKFLAARKEGSSYYLPPRRIAALVVLVVVGSRSRDGGTSVRSGIENASVNKAQHCRQSDRRS